MEIPAILKQHPAWFIGGGIALVLLIVISKGSSSASSGPTSGDVALQSNTDATNVQLANIAANAQVATTTANDQTTAALAQAATTQQGQTAALAASQSSGLITAVLGALSLQSNENASNNSLTSQLAAIYANVKTHAMDTNVQSQALADATTTTLAGLSTAQTVALAQQQSNQVIAAISGQTSTTNTATQAQAQVATNANNNQAAQTNASTAQTTSYIQDAGEVAAIAAMFA